MFSIITMASSTTKPVAMVSAISVRVLIEKPNRYIAPKVPTSASGTAVAGMKVARALRRKMKITSTTSTTESSSSKVTSLMAARMVTVRSDSTESWAAPGSCACRLGSSL